MSDINPITIPFDEHQTARSQIATALAAVPSHRCPDHPQELLVVDVDYTVERTLSSDREQPQIKIGLEWGRCTKCPYSTHPVWPNVDLFRCAAGDHDWPAFVHGGRKPPSPSHAERLPLEPDTTVAAQAEAWIACYERRCEASGEVLALEGERVVAPESLLVTPQFHPCPQCGLDRLGLTPDEARASFESFVVEPPELEEHFRVCRDFAASPKGVLLLAGNTGTGKTHLTIGILRERLRVRGAAPIFIRHRQFMAEYLQSQRPVGFGQESPENPLVRCQQADLRVRRTDRAPSQPQLRRCAA
jgi:hypothetical protein